MKALHFPVSEEHSRLTADWMFLPRGFCSSRSFYRFRRFLIVCLILTLYICLRDEISWLFSSQSESQREEKRIMDAIDTNIIDHKVIRALPQIALDRVSTQEIVACVLVFCANRPQAIKNHLEQLMRVRPSPLQFPILVSQDGNTETIADAIKPFVNHSSNVMHIQHEKKEPPRKMTRSDKNYLYISQHYKWALDYAFRTLNHTHVIITEDDLDISNDFFSYFLNLRPLLTADPTIWCISAWNDNGGKELTDRSNPSKLWRTDFFPGLGWMLHVNVWNEMRDRWPERYWDDWMRSADVRKDRSCIRPEVSRTAHNMKLAGKGTSGGLYKTYLSSITLPEETVDFSRIDMSFLVKERYDALLATLLAESEKVTGPPSNVNTEHSYRLTYSTVREWRKIADDFKLMNDIRSGMPRTAYMGVVTLWWKGARFFIIPSWLDIEELRKGELHSKYDSKWDLQSKFMDFAKQYCKPSRYTGPCDPAAPELKEWFRRRNMLKKFEAWGEMIIV